MSTEYKLILFDDGVYCCVKSSDTRISENGETSARWKHGWYKVKIVFSGNKEICESLLDSIVKGVPRVDVEHGELSSASNQGFQKIPFYYDSDDSVQDPDYFPESDHSLVSSEQGKKNGDDFAIENTDGNMNFHEILIEEEPENARSFTRETFISKNAEFINRGNSTPVLVKCVSDSKSGKCKQYFCCYCHKLVTKFARHLECWHKDEAAVIKIMSCAKASKERKVLIDQLRKKGNFIFNTENVFNNGNLIVSRRPQAQFTKNGYDYKPCPNCKEYYSNKSIRRHYIRCKQGVSKNDRSLFPLSRALKGQIHKKASSTLRDQVFPKLRDDSVTQIVAFDELAILYGNSLCNKYRKPHLQAMIRSKLRLIGRLMLSLKELNPKITDFTSIFTPSLYDDVIKGVNSVALLGENSNYKSPSTAFAIGTLLKKCSKILINEFIKRDDEDGVKKTKYFLSILEEDFASSVNKTVEENQKEMKRLKKINLPSMNDVKLFNQYLEDNRTRLYFLLKNEYSFITWKALSEYTLISVQVFNRRRAGEIERINIEDFMSYKSVNQDVDSDIYDSLSEEAKSIAEKYVRFEIRGKLGRSVPVLLHTNLLNCMKLIIHHRKEAGVSEHNPFVFGIPGGDNKYFRACVLMRRFSKSCGAKNPHSLRGTELRKHIATRSVLLNLEEQEVSDLATFLGHADKIHKDHYRIPIVTRDIVRMSRLLEIAQGEPKMVDEDNAPSVSSEEPTVSYEKSSNQDNRFIQIESLNQNAANQTTGKRSRSPCGYIKRISWTDEEKDIVTTYFRQHFEKNTLPSTEACYRAISENSELHNRSPLQLKSYISNQIQKRGKGLKRKRGATLYWTPEEKKLMKGIFSRHIIFKKVPSFAECKDVIDKHDILKNRTKETVKAWVYNIIKKDNSKDMLQS